jgi:hypothetical protein
MGKDRIIHSGEGTISAIKWSLTSKYVAWANEHGIWIYRTDQQLEKFETDDAWKTVDSGHVDRPNSAEWDMMASVWKARIEWIDEDSVEPDDAEPGKEPADALKLQSPKTNKKSERLLVGWGGIIWLISVKPGGIGVGKDVGEKSRAQASMVKKYVKIASSPLLVLRAN